MNKVKNATLAASTGLLAVTSPAFAQSTLDAHQSTAVAAVTEGSLVMYTIAGAVVVTLIFLAFIKRGK